jgi:hypothetical protein
MSRRNPEGVFSPFPENVLYNILLNLEEEEDVKSWKSTGKSMKKRLIPPLKRIYLDKIIDLIPKNKIYVKLLLEKYNDSQIKYFYDFFLNQYFLDLDDEDKKKYIQYVLQFTPDFDFNVDEYERIYEDEEDPYQLVSEEEGLVYHKIFGNRIKIHDERIKLIQFLQENDAYDILLNNLKKFDKVPDDLIDVIEEMSPSEIREFNNNYLNQYFIDLNTSDKIKYIEYLLLNDLLNDIHSIYYVPTIFISLPQILSS